MTAGVPLIQGGRDAQETAQRLFVAIIVCGLAIVAAQPLVSWITGYSKETVEVDTDGNGVVDDNRTYWTKNPGQVNDGMTEDAILKYAMPSEVTTIFDKVIMAIQGIAGLVMVIAIVWGGIQLRAKPRFPRDEGR